MGAVVEQLLPAPIRYRLAWHDAHAKPPLYVWRGIPPSQEFVALGMIVTTSEDPPGAATPHGPRRAAPPAHSTASSARVLVESNRGVGLQS
jgi:hypothetical protein